jgi:hypothetical protein
LAVCTTAVEVTGIIEVTGMAAVTGIAVVQVGAAVVVTATGFVYPHRRIRQVSSKRPGYQPVLTGWKVVTVVAGAATTGENATTGVAQVLHCALAVPTPMLATIAPASANTWENLLKRFMVFSQSKGSRGPTPFGNNVLDSPRVEWQ